MNCCKTSIWKLWIFLILVIALIALLSYLGAGQNELIKCFYNEHEISAGKFLQIAGKEIQDWAEYTGNEIYKIRILGGENLAQIYTINFIAVYYNEGMGKEKH